MTIIQPAQPFVQQPNLTEVVVIPDGTIRPVPGRQGISVLLGIGADSCGTQGLCMNIAEIPPGYREEAHWHIDSESALYMLPGSGRAVTYWGENLEQEVWTGPGDFLFFPPGVRHLGVNPSGEAARAVVARTDNRDQLRVRTFDIPEHLAHIAVMPTVTR